MTQEEINLMRAKLHGVATSVGRQLAVLIEGGPANRHNALAQLVALREYVQALDRRHQLEVQLAGALVTWICGPDGNSGSPTPSSPTSPASPVTSCECSSPTPPTSEARTSRGPAHQGFIGSQGFEWIRSDVSGLLLYVADGLRDIRRTPRS